MLTLAGAKARKIWDLSHYWQIMEDGNFISLGLKHYQFWREKLLHHLTDPAPMTWGSQCTWELNTWLVFSQGGHLPSDTRTSVRLTSQDRFPQYRTQLWCHTTCLSGWRNQQLKCTMEKGIIPCHNMPYALNSTTSLKYPRNDRQSI